MSYATLDDMMTRFGAEALLQLTQRDAEQSTFDAAVVQAALDDATDLVDGYAAGRYAVPLNPVPAPVRRWCADIARYYLCSAGMGATDDIRKMFEDAIHGLVDMKKGVIVFQAEGISTPETQAGSGVAFTGPQRVFTADTLKGF